MLRKINDGCGSDCVCVVLVKDLEMVIHTLLKKWIKVLKTMARSHAEEQKLNTEIKQQTIIHINIITKIQNEDTEKKTKKDISK